MRHLTGSMPTARGALHFHLLSPQARTKLRQASSSGWLGKGAVSGGMVPAGYELFELVLCSLPKLCAVQYNFLRFVQGRFVAIQSDLLPSDCG